MFGALEVNWSHEIVNFSLSIFHQCIALGECCSFQGKFIPIQCLDDMNRLTNIQILNHLWIDVTP